ncbi:hypothetical protein H5410_030972 [Solanum commersonii]|uniref:Uncharacterized protein n=1 Tax=Solanum commersonii TaxID=4109 RepID=A0A9J5YH32_SOLCO|nr:hypothetical protein H5410_030972 [Solanum commersonii]
MGEVKIVKRGQVVLSTINGLGMITIADFYCGSDFSSSPPPSSLLSDNLDATSDLRRLLTVSMMMMID